jgi:LppX_LprAFG lipoprotein
VKRIFGSFPVRKHQPAKANQRVDPAYGWTRSPQHAAARRWSERRFVPQGDDGGWESIPAKAIFGRAMLLLALFFAFTFQAMAPFSAKAQQTDAEAKLKDVAETMLGLDSFHFDFSTPEGKTLLADQIELVGVEGDVQRPDKFQATFRVKAAIVELALDAIGVGRDVWVEDPIGGGEFVKVTGNEGDETVPPLDFLNPDNLVDKALRSLKDAKVEGEEELNGQSTTTYTGTFDPNDLEAAEDGAFPGIEGDIEPLKVKLWVDDQNRLLRMELEGPLLEAEKDTGRIVRRIEFSTFNEPLAIEPPQ